VDMDESKCDTFFSTECGCIFHYDDELRYFGYYCKKCNKEITGEKISALSFNYFVNGYLRWIGQFQKCKRFGCDNRGNPRRFGLCHIHGETICTDNSLIFAFIYMTKFVTEREQRRVEVFAKVLAFMDKYYRYSRLDIVDFDYAREILNINNLLHR